MGPLKVVPYAVAIGAVTVLIRDYMMGAVYEGKDRMDGKTVIITGANTGLGKETAKELVRRGARVIMACRDMSKCESALKEILAETGAGDDVICQHLNLASFVSIRRFAKEINQAEARLDVLINNAGVILTHEARTEDGMEMHIGVNHLGHFLLTELLLDKLKESRPSRIVTVASMAHSWGVVNLDDLNSRNHYNRYRAYCQSKLANILHTNQLARRLIGCGVTANSLHPGTVVTENSQDNHWITYPLSLFFSRTAWNGAQTSLRLAIDPALENVTGKYFSDCEETLPNENALDEEVAMKLWDISEELTKETPKDSGSEGRTPVGQVLTG